MGRDPSGSAGTGQAKMGSRAGRGRGGSCSALRLRRGGVGVAARCILASPRLPLLRCLRLVKHPSDRNPSGRPPAPRKLSPRGRAELQSGEKRARKGPPCPPPTRAFRPGCGDFAYPGVASRGVFPSAGDPPWKLHLSGGDIFMGCDWLLSWRWKCRCRVVGSRSHPVD